MTASSLRITTKPFRSSFLTIPPSPFSPKFPIAPQAPPTVTALKTRPDLDLPSPPPKPLHWLWQCHVCNRVYQLGVTRRCLDDGHYFCAGTTTTKRSKRSGKNVVRHKACASEFDYQGWKNWSEWRRDVHQQLEAAETLEQFLKADSSDEDVPMLEMPEAGRWLNGSWTKKTVTREPKADFWGKDCWNNCDYPSDCRWGQAVGCTKKTATLTVATETSSDSNVAATSPSAIGGDEPAVDFDDILIDFPDLADETLSEGDSDEQTPAPSPTSPIEEKKPSMDDLLESANRRKRLSADAVRRPLALNPPSPDATTLSNSVLHRAFDDFDLDLRRSFGRAGEAMSSLFGGSRDDAKVEGSGRWRRKSSKNGTW